MVIQIFSWNICGWKSILSKGFTKFLENYRPDIICLQEIRTRDINIPFDPIYLKYHIYINPSRRKGFHGTAILTKIKPIRVIKKIGFTRFDLEGRFLRLDFKNFILINIYMPHGGRFKENMDYKLKAYDVLLNYLAEIRNLNIVLAGDFNIAHKPIDLARPRENMNNTMFTLEERSRIDKLVEIGFIDTFREFNNMGGYYTWWPRSYRAREKNIGWRIDYIFISSRLRKYLVDAFILSISGSDHCPIGIKLRFD